MAVWGAAVPSTVTILPGSCGRVGGWVVHGRDGCADGWVGGPPTTKRPRGAAGQHPQYPPASATTTRLRKLLDLVGKGADDEAAEEDGDDLQKKEAQEGQQSTMEENSKELQSCNRSASAHFHPIISIQVCP